MTTAGVLMRLAGWLSFDSGHHPQAQRYWVAGLHAAHAAGDRALGANIIGFMSAQAIDLGQVRESVTLAETSRAGYSGATPLACQAVETLSGEVDSARCVGHLARLVGDLAPYRRRPAVRQFTEQANGLLGSHA